MTCPLCGARQVRMADECWLCGTSRGEDGLLGSGGGETRFSFSLGTLLWINTLVALCCALVVLLPGLGLILSVLLLLVGGRTLLVLKRRRDRGMVTRSWDKVSLLARSFVRTIVLVILAGFTLMEFFVLAVLILFLAAKGFLSDAVLASILGASMTVVLWLLATIVIGIEKRFHLDTSRPDVS
jgi:hypothetical protein